MQFPNYCQTRGDRLAHAIRRLGEPGFLTADLARLIDAEFPVEIEAASQADDVEMRVRDLILDSLRELDPQTAGVASTATWLAGRLRTAGLIRG